MNSDILLYDKTTKKGVYEKKPLKQQIKQVTFLSHVCDPKLLEVFLAQSIEGIQIPNFIYNASLSKPSSTKKVNVLNKNIEMKNWF